MINLDDIYSKGKCAVPPPGKYAVEMSFYGQPYQILEKRIFKGYGRNYLPIFLLKPRIKIMDFKIYMGEGEVIFKYPALPLEDRLKKIDYRTYMGMIYWKGVFLDYFFLVKI